MICSVKGYKTTWKAKSWKDTTWLSVSQRTAALLFPCTREVKLDAGPSQALTLLIYFVVQSLAANTCWTHVRYASLIVELSFGIAWYIDILSSISSTHDNDSISSWCGWHTDHGSLTGVQFSSLLLSWVVVVHLKFSWLLLFWWYADTFSVCDMLIKCIFVCISTGLTRAIFSRDSVEVPCPDPASGLYIQTRSGQIVKVLHWSFLMTVHSMYKRILFDI